MSNEVIKVLDHICDKFGIAIDWSSSNVMPYLQDLMVRMTKYVTYTSILWLVISILTIVASIYLCIKFIKLSRDTYYDDMVVGCCAVITPIIVIIFFLVGVTACENLIEVNTVPEKYIIEMIQDATD
ncbi:MAG: hypothetical protein ACLR4X_04860 [Clostridia bacterium]